jgi:hypothetical protein
MRVFPQPFQRLVARMITPYRRVSCCIPSGRSEVGAKDFRTYAQAQSNVDISTPAINPLPRATAGQRDETAYRDFGVSLASIILVLLPLLLSACDTTQSDWVDVSTRPNAKFERASAECRSEGADRLILPIGGIWRVVGATTAYNGCMARHGYVRRGAGSTR